MSMYAPKGLLIRGDIKCIQGENDPSCFKEATGSDGSLNQGDLYGGHIPNMYANELFRQRIGVVLPVHKDR